jgi:alpha-beta hydrolase superfamily lysophospholipase
MTTKKEYFFPANSGEGEIYVRSWIPENKPKAILILLHGMAEHADRFEDFAHYLNEQDILVVANDVAGHGKSTQLSGDFGPNGWRNNIKDIKRVYDDIVGEYSGLPIFMLGNSMGTSLARSFITRYEGIDGCILIGTMDRNPIANIAKAQSGVLAKIRGNKAKSKSSQLAAFSTFSREKKYRNSGLPRLFDVKAFVRQLTRNKLVIGEPFTESTYMELYKGIIETTSKSWAKSISESTAFLVASGEFDPVGYFGKSVRQLASELKDNGNKDVTEKLFEKRSHEILQYAKNKDVFEYVRNWIVERI